jgi:VIT1/CCC1 family predicted Fe2+/Mn2+ transporter
LLFELSTAIFLSVVWGLFLLGLLSLHLAKRQKKKPWKVIVEHLTIALLVITIAHYVGDWVSLTFG